MTVSLPPLADVIAQHGLAAKKSLGQHFLLDENLIAKIARAAGGVTDHTAIEIGPGPGGLTRALLAAGAREVVAVEKDTRCLEALAGLEAAYPGRLRVVRADALQVYLPALTAAPRKIVANLPYNVGTAMLVQWLQEIASNSTVYASLTLMFQREVAMRIGAEPGSKDYGRLSVLAQWLCDVHRHFDLPPGAFSPPPSVYSSVITLTPLPAPRFPVQLSWLEKVLAAAFGQRRKMLRQSLKSMCDDPVAHLEQLGIDPTRRAETLSVQEFCALAGALAQRSDVRHEQ